MLEHIQTLSGHQNPVYALINSNEPGFFFSAGNDKGIVEWSLDRMSFVKVKMPVQSSVYCLEVHNQLLFIGERSGAFSVYDLIEEKVIYRINAHAKAIFSIKVIARKKEVLTTGEDGEAAVWSLQDFSLIYRFQISSTTVRCIALKPGETEVAFGAKDNQIYIFNLDDYSLQYQLTGHTHPITALAYHPGGNYLISGSRDAQLKIWTLPKYELKQTVPAHLFAIYQIAFHPTLPYFVTCSQDKTVKLWDANLFKLYKILSLEKTGTGHAHSVNNVIWTSDGKYLISTGDDRKVMIWKLRND